MSSRLRHRLKLAVDPHIMQAMVAAGTVCVLSAGLVYLGYFVHVTRVALRSSCQPAHGECLLVFGKHAPGGRVDDDFDARLRRAESLLRERPQRQVLLLGGGPDGAPAEAQVAHDVLRARGVPHDIPLQLEMASRDTLQNLRNARDLLRAIEFSGPVTLLSNRYHLARCSKFATQLGMKVETCAAEPRLGMNFETLRKLAGEAAYVCLTDVGTRWARLIRSRRMLERIS